jgi:hypothetical protein
MAAICSRIELVFSPTPPLLVVSPNLVRGGELHVVDGAHVGEEGLQPVVVGLRDRIVLVIVAARAAKRQSGEDLPDRVRDVVQDLLPALHQIARVRLIRVVAVERGRDASVGIERP